MTIWTGPAVPGNITIKEKTMPKIVKQQEVTITHTDTNGHNIPDGGKGERLARGEARWTTGGRRIDGAKKEGSDK